MPTTYPLYFDYQATTPTDPAVVDAMLPFFTEKYGNPHSAEHVYGWEAEAAVTIASERISDVLKSTPEEIIFTSGATESNNLALKGVMEFYSYQKKDHLITVATEHKCVLESCAFLERIGFKVTYLPVCKEGLIDLNQLEDAITPYTALVSVMHVNNEIGVIQPIEQIGTICAKHDVFFHCDAAQSFGKLPIDVTAMGIHLLSISGHKCYGPKGIGALYVSKSSRIRLSPQIHGGNQQKGLRSGTIPTPLVVGLGMAAHIAHDVMDQELKRVKNFYQTIYQKLFNPLEGVHLNGDLHYRYPGNINCSIDGVEEQSLITSLRNLAISSGSACSSGSPNASYVLQALGVKPERIKSSLRIGLGRYTTKQDVDTLITTLISTITTLRSS